MQRSLLFLFFIGLTVAAYGQKATILTTPVTDSVRVKINKSTKVKDVNGVEMHANKDIIQNLNIDPEFSITIKAIRAAGLTGTFKSKGPITFFAPNNQAFAKLPKGRIDTLMKQAHILELCNLITCHAIAGKITIKKISKAIKAGKGTAVFTTLSGCKLMAKMNAADTIVLIDELGNETTIEISDIEQSNGLMHVINGIIVPKNKTVI